MSDNRFTGRAGRGPLTLGQRNTLAWVDQELDRFSAVVSWRFPLPETASVAEVQRALTTLVARHEALRTHFEGGREQVVAGIGEVLVELRDVTEEPSTTDELADRLVTELRAAGVDFTAGPPLRFVLATRSGKPAALVAAYSHMAVDFGSAALLGREFDQLLAGVPLPDPEHQPLDQAHVEQSAHGRRQAANAVRYWEESLLRAPQAMCTLPPPAAPVAGHRTGFLRSPAAGRALTAIALRTGASRQAIVVAALSSLLCHRTGVDQSTFVSISSNRFRLRLRGYVGTLAQDGLLALTVSGGSFDELVGRAVKASLAAYTNSIFDSTELWQVIDSVGERRGIAFSRDFTINDISAHLGTTEVDGEAGDGPSSLEWADAPPFPTVLMCNPVQLAPELQLALTYDGARLDGVEVENLLWAVEKLVVAAATADVRLADLTAVTGLTPFARDDDWTLVDGCWIRLSATRALLAEAARRPVEVTVVDGQLRADLSTDERAAALALIRAGDHRLAKLPC